LRLRLRGRSLLLEEVTDPFRVVPLISCEALWVTVVNDSAPIALG